MISPKTSVSFFLIFFLCVNQIPPAAAAALEQALNSNQAKAKAISDAFFNAGKFPEGLSLPLHLTAKDIDCSSKPDPQFCQKETTQVWDSDASRLKQENRRNYDRQYKEQNEKLQKEKGETLPYDPPDDSHVYRSKQEWKPKPGDPAKTPSPSASPTGWRDPPQQTNPSAAAPEAPCNELCRLFTHLGRPLTRKKQK